MGQHRFKGPSRKGMNLRDKRQTKLRLESRRLLAMLMRVREWLPKGLFRTRTAMQAFVDVSEAMRSADALPAVQQLRHLLHLALRRKHKRMPKREPHLRDFVIGLDDEVGFAFVWWTDPKNDEFTAFTPAKRPTSNAEWRTAWRHVWRAARCQAREDGFAGLYPLPQVDPEEPNPWWTATEGKVA